jgi:hypothetical protein
MSAFDITEIDEVIHGRLRLGVMAYLSGSGAADFNELKGALQASDGNLSVHLRKLEQFWNELTRGGIPKVGWIGESRIAVDSGGGDGASLLRGFAYTAGSLR